MKFYILIILVFIGSITVSQNQQFKTSVMVSPGISWYNSSNAEVGTDIMAIKTIKNKGINFCFSGAIREEFYFSKVISLGIELSYLNINGNFESPNPLSQNSIPEIYDIYKHSLSIHSLEIPVLFKFRTKEAIDKGIYFNFGMGINYIIHSDRTVNRETGYMGTAPTSIVSVTNGSVTLKTQHNNSIGTIGIFEIGKNIAIKNKILFCEVKYRFDLNNWLYPTVNDPVNSTFNIKRLCLLLNIGMTF